MNEGKVSNLESTELRLKLTRHEDQRDSIRNQIEELRHESPFVKTYYLLLELGHLAPSDLESNRLLDVSSLKNIASHPDIVFYHGLQNLQVALEVEIKKLTERL